MTAIHYRHGRFCRLFSIKMINTAKLLALLCLYSWSNCAALFNNQLTIMRSLRTNARLNQFKGKCDSRRVRNQFILSMTLGTFNNFSNKGRSVHPILNHFTPEIRHQHHNRISIRTSTRTSMRTGMSMSMTSLPQDPYTAVMIIPTGIGAKIGGYAGDALPSARYTILIALIYIVYHNFWVTLHH